jgi:two-component system sensor histidine kinase KdpD
VTDENRPSPDALLSSIQRDEAASKRGRLKVFLGMCPGVGKTYAMLEAARREQAAGRDVAIGYVETHGRKETDALTEGLPGIPRKQVDYRGITLTEMDLDAVLARKPQLALVDEFAHTNRPGSRHPKRYQDILELVEAGIDVFTTLNIQHVESRADAVRQITGVTVQETVPDPTLDDAELELVDLPPDELRARLAAGKVYVPERIRAAQENFFRPGNLAALRELALRFAAEHVGQDVLEYRQSLGIADPWKSGQRLLVAVSSSPTSASLLRWTRRLAGELHAPWLAVYVELPRSLSDQDQKRLSRHLALARALGAQVITTSGDDVVRALLRVAREQNATQLVVGKPAGWRILELFHGRSLLNRLIKESGHIDIHVIRAEGEEAPFRRPSPPRLTVSAARAYGAVVGVVALLTVINLLLQGWIGYVPVSLIFLLSVIVLGLFVGRGPTLVAATLTALAWNFCFTEPRFTFRIHSPADTMMFVTYFVVALVMGHLTARLRSQQDAERRREERATALYLLIRELSKATDFPDLLAVAIREVGKTFQAEAAISLPDDGNRPALLPYFASTWTMTEKEQSVAAWAFRYRQPAGRGTDTLPSADGLHVPLLAGERAVGVLSLRFRDSAPLLPAQRDLLDAFAPQIALVLDRQRLRDEEQKAELLGQSERLGKTLLNSVSHELRTPLAAISSAAGGLASAGPLTPEQQTLAEELDQAAIRLNRLVRNLLDLSRLEAGHLHAKLDWHDPRDVVNAAMQTQSQVLAGHTVRINAASDLPLVKLDAALTEQILGNLLNNAAVHTPPGTAIEISARAEASHFVLEVADRGPGLPPGDPVRLFERFQRGPNAAPGGTGIGLSLVKGFAEAQQGNVAAANRPGGGAVFTVRLPLVKMPPVPAENE